MNFKFTGLLRISRLKILMMFAGMVLCATGNSLATTPDGTVAFEQKINDVQGNLGAVLSDSDLFGWSAAGIGDLNNDGIEDMAVGVYLDDDGGTDRGAVWILFLDTDGTVKSKQKISSTAGNFNGVLDDTDRFGSSVADIGDLDSDGVTDLAVGANQDTDPTSMRGAVWILFMNSNGTVKSEQKISESEGNFNGGLDFQDTFGWSVSALGDLDGDGVLDIAVGAPDDDDGGTNHGAVWILFLNMDGTVKSREKISAVSGEFNGSLDNEDKFGSSVTRIGDLDGDGNVDLAVGAYGDDDGGTNNGAIWILFMNSNGTVKNEQKISDTSGNFGGALSDHDFFGWATTWIGDLNNDGIPDLAVSEDGGGGSGAIWILFLNTDGTVKSYQKISDTEGNFDGVIDNNDTFGSAVSILGDINNDGVVEIIVGAGRDDENGADRGAVWVLFMAGAETNTAECLAFSNTNPDGTEGFNNDDLFVQFNGTTATVPVEIGLFSTSGTLSGLTVATIVDAIASTSYDEYTVGTFTLPAGASSTSGDITFEWCLPDRWGGPNQIPAVVTLASRSAMLKSTTVHVTLSPPPATHLAFSNVVSDGTDGFNNNQTSVNIGEDVDLNLAIWNAFGKTRSKDESTTLSLSIVGGVWNANAQPIFASANGDLNLINPLVVHINAGPNDDTFDGMFQFSWNGPECTSVTLQLHCLELQSSTIVVNVCPATCASVTHLTISSGFDATSNSIVTIGSLDPSWQIISDPNGPLFAPQAAQAVPAQVGWANAQGASQWLSASGSSTTSSAGVYSYRSYVCLADNSQQQLVRLNLDLMAAEQAELYLNDRKLLRTGANSSNVATSLDTMLYLDGARHSLRIDVESSGAGTGFNLAGAIETSGLNLKVSNDCCQDLYSITGVTIECGQNDESFSDGRFYVPLNADSPVEPGIVGIDYCLRYNRDLCEPTGRLRFGDVVMRAVSSDTSKAGYAINSLSSDHQVRVGVHYSASAGTSAEFIGAGEVAAIEFRLKAGVEAGAIATFSSCELLESYQTHTVSRTVKDGLLQVRADSVLEGTVHFWTEAALRELRPIGSDGDPANSLPTRVFGIDHNCVTRSNISVLTDSDGHFNYHLGNGAHISIERDIAGSYHDNTECTVVLPFINGWDAYWAYLITIQNSSWVPGPFAVVAADVNLDGVVSIVDVSHILNRAVGNFCEFPQQWNYGGGVPAPTDLSLDWRFIDSTTIASSPSYLPSTTFPSDDLSGYSRFRIPSVPQCLPVKVYGESENCTSVAPESFSGVLLGDVNGNWVRTDGVLIKDGNDDVVLSDLDYLRLLVDNPIPLEQERRYRLFVEGSFSDVTNAIDFTLAYDPSLIQIDEVRPGDSGSEAELQMAWNASDGRLTVSSFSLVGLRSEGLVFEVDVTCLVGDSVKPSDFGNIDAYINGRKVVVTSVESTQRSQPTGNLQALSLSPNPSQDQASISFRLQRPSRVQISLATLTGGLAINPIELGALDSGTHAIELDLSNLSGGVYILHVNTTHESQSDMLFIVR